VPIVSVNVSGDLSLAEEDSSTVVCRAQGVHHQYGDQVALAGVDYSARSGQISALLGPNGSGKTTLFRLLCTLLPLQRGRITIAGIDVAEDPLAVRGQIGIVFQSPSLDNKLTVDENMACQGALYGITGARLKSRCDELLQRFQLTDRRRDLCQSLSGGLKRRVELAKGMLHRPKLLLLDEPSTGLDPSARLGLWTALRGMAGEGMAILLTTHLLEEADKADRIALLCEGKKIADGTPGGLREEMGGGIITIITREPDEVERVLREEFELQPQRIENQLRLQSDMAATLVAQLAERISQHSESITIGRPSLEDFFVARTGHPFA
jgi:ABC-2 type transport system ATP-binding protein